ncbi:MAG: hypothetical protein LUG52_04095 [Clostridia bacterium]|nr:hypothetical protein [Clostridia bacterium]
MFCGNCGREIKDGVAFYPFCGGKIEKTNQITPAETASMQPVDTRGGQKISTVSKIIAAVSSVVFLISIYLPFFSVFLGSYSIYLACSEYFDFTPIMVILVICTVIFLAFQFTNHGRLSIIGLVGIWIWTLFVSCAFCIVSSKFVYNYTFGAGFYFLYIGVIGQIVALIKK